MHFDPPIVPLFRRVAVFLQWSLLYRSPVVAYFDHGHPCFRNFKSTISVDVIRAKSYANSFLDPTCVPVRVSINKFDLIPDRIMVGLMGVFRNGRGLGTGESYIPVMFFDPLLHRSPCFSDADFAALTGNPVDNTILFSPVDGVLWSH